MHYPTDFILPLFDVWEGSSYQTQAVFGVAYVDLPPEMAEDLRALINIKAKLNAKQG